MLHRSGFRTTIDLQALLEVGRWLQEQLGRTVPGMLLKAGTFPRAAAS
jgi:hydroxymethylglutaryl-CoA lyase